MTLWKRLRQMVWAVREYPEIHSSLEATRYELRQSTQALKHSERERKKLAATLSHQTHRLDFAEHKAEAVLSALKEFCPRLSTLEEMKQLYATVSPSLDPSGFTLYHIAKKVTGIDLYSYFAYEDSHGMFEEMDGHRLLHWLTAAHFHAVDWTIVPGTCYEAATLRDVDTDTPEYRAFESKLYRAVLERMGFGDFLSHESPITPQKIEVIAAKEKVKKGGEAR